MSLSLFLMIVNRGVICKRNVQSFIIVEVHVCDGDKENEKFGISRYYDRLLMTLVSVHYGILLLASWRKMHESIENTWNRKELDCFLYFLRYLQCWTTYKIKETSQLSESLEFKEHDPNRWMGWKYRKFEN